MNPVRIAPSRIVAALALLLVLGLAGCMRLPGQTGVSVTKTGENPAAVPAGTDPEDSVIGRREHPHILATYGGVYSNRSAEIIVAKIAGRLLSAANQGNEKYTVTLLDTPDVNAFALPGGYIYVTRGMLALANDESELAAVLAHEIAHVTLKHAQARANREHTSEIVDKVITSVLGGNAATDQTAERSKVALAAFSQAQEFAADKEGILTAAKAGYDPSAAARFLGAMGRFAALSSGGDGQSDDFLSSHPSTPERIRKATEIAQSLTTDGAAGEVGRAQYLAAIDGLTFGDSPAHGAIIGRKFVQPDLNFTFTVPRTYTLQSAQPAVVAVANDGEAVRFDAAEVPQTMSLEDYLRSGWIAGLDPGSVRSLDYHGNRMAEGVARTDEWDFRVAVVRFEGEVYRFIFAARKDSPDFAKAVDDTLKSFRKATKQDLAQIQVASVRLVTAQSGDTTLTLAARMGKVDNARNLFLVLNNLYPGDPVKPGWQYKIVSVR